MTGARLFVQEGATLAPKKSDGTYPVVLITEGEGSSGRYSGDLIARSEHVFTNVGSFLNHPIDPAKPHLRDVNTLAGRIGTVTVGEDGGKRALLSTFKPRKEYAEFIEEYQDLLKLSIFCSADGEVLEDGRLDVQAFDANDPYRSVDIVVAAGRGGRFQQAEESLRVIESSLGLPQGNQPGATAAPGDRNVMEIKDVFDAVKALESSLASTISFVNELKVAADAAVAEAETKVSAVEQEKDAAIEAYSAAVKAVSEAKLLPSQEASILDAAKRGEDVAPLVESAKKVLEEAQSATEASGYVIESAGASGAKHDFSFNFGGVR